MILPMKKVCIMVQDKTRVDALRKLRAAGVMHLERRDAPVDVNSTALKQKAKVEDSIGLIQDFKLPKKKKVPVIPGDPRTNRERRQTPTGMHRGRRASDVFGTEAEAPYSLDAVRATKRPYLPDMMVGFGEERKELKEQDFTLSREIMRIEGWGEFDPKTITEMNDWIPTYLYEISPEVFSHLDKDIQYIRIKSDKSVVRLLVIEKPIPGVTPFQLPQQPLSELVQEEEKIKADLLKIEEKLKNFADRRPALNKEMALVLYDLEFETANAGLYGVDEIPDDMKLSWFTGYVPAEDLDRLKEIARNNAWGISADDPPVTDEKVPSKLRNNKFVNLLTPITGFLEITPGYREVDISPFFLFFFCIFFGMIYGDAGYGLLLTSTGIAAVCAMAIKKKKIPLAFPMLILLGSFNVTWGLLTCSWFGIESQNAPQFLKNISLSYISTAKSTQDVVNQNMQIFCFSLGLIHLSIAHIINMVRAKSLRILGELGYIGMLLGMYNVVLMLIVSNDTRTIPLHPAAIPVIACGWVLFFLFGAYRDSMGQSIKSSLGNIMSVILGVVSIFSDVMSYIRLWAVGLAGAAIASTVNLLAGPMLGSFLIFFGIILLAFGHGMNIVLNVLSVLVHGVRLNTLEFSGHVGITWSGTAYRPFAEKEIK